MDKLWLKEDLSWEQKKKAIEASLIMGFYSTTAMFPITSREKGIQASEIYEKMQRDNKKARDWPENYIPANRNAKAIPGFDWRQKKGLEYLFSNGLFLEDENLDQLPDKLNFKIHIPKDCDLSMLISACNFAFRFGMETTAFEGSIIASENWEGNLLLFEESNRSGIDFIEERQRIIVRIYGQGRELEEFSSKICENFPLLPDNKTWIDQLKYVTDSFAMRNLDGQLTYLNAYKEELEGAITAFVSPEIDTGLYNIQSVFPKVKFINHKSNKRIYEKSYDIPWEVDTFRNILEQKVYPFIKSGDEVKIFGALSEGIDVRMHLNNEIEQEITRLGANAKKIELICAYKQGFSWIEEIIMPQLKGRAIQSIEIAFKPFLPKGETRWPDEYGAVPSYHNLNADNPDKWFDLPIRYLQELYPVDDLIAEELGIDKDRIQFALYKGNEDITYELKASGEKKAFSFKYKAAYSERPYLDEYPQMGKVHPSTGFIIAIINGKQVVNEHIKTDLEDIWDIYQMEVLPDCKNFIETKIKDCISIDTQPFFSELRIMVNASEPEYRLPFREDMISSLNSLHEDMYFVATDYFKNFGLQKSNVLLDAPGLILPILKNTRGKPEFKVELYDQLEKDPCIKGNNKTIKALFDREEIELYIKGIKYIDDRITVILNTNIKDELVESYIRLLGLNKLNISKEFSNIDILEIETNKNTYAIPIISEQMEEKNTKILDIDLLENTLIGYEQYLAIIKKLKQVDGINVFKIATSYLGRDIYAIEMLPKIKGYTSRTKRITNFPTEIINCRHHANEVSSTNGAFMLLKKLLTEKDYMELYNKMNLIIIPMENVDGTQIHYELQKDNPNWKLHVARFNAIGKEFYYEHFNPNTIHTEAMGITRLWERYLPDIIVDNHGVPSHEWEQQFSGYASPSYKGFWLPRSLLYGYFWFVTNDEYRSNYSVNKKLEEVIAEAIAQNEEISKWNRKWMPIFKKYAHSWMPKLFPADYYKDMINYWIPFEFDLTHRYPSIRFPWITTVAYTAEVADETAQGDYLNLCARAHVAHDEAVIKMLMNSTCLFEERYEATNEKISICRIRQRPIIV